MIRWMQAIIDVPEPDFERETDFWVEVTASQRGDVHPEHPEFLHLRPAAGDMHLEMQRLVDGPVSVHLDVQVDDIPAATQRAVSCGATVVAQPGHVVLTTPAGMAFCIVPYFGETTRAELIDADAPHAADQICLDIPSEGFEADVAFWAAFTGWNDREPIFEEFRSFHQPTNLPLRLLVQRLGPDDDGPPRAHLDISSGRHRQHVVERHVAAGASIVESGSHWTTMRSPSGLPYCITDRVPDEPV